MYCNINLTYFNNMYFNKAYFNVFNPPGSLMKSRATPPRSGRPSMSRIACLHEYRRPSRRSDADFAEVGLTIPTIPPGRASSRKPRRWRPLVDAVAEGARLIHHGIPSPALCQLRYEPGWRPLETDHDVARPITTTGAVRQGAWPTMMTNVHCLTSV